MASLCSLCKNDTESTRHLFSTCPYAMALWDILGYEVLSFFYWFRFSYWAFFSIFFRSTFQVANLLHAAMVLVFSIIWYVRNKYIFQKKFIPIVRAFVMLLSWLLMLLFGKVLLCITKCKIYVFSGLWMWSQSCLGLHALYLSCGLFSFRMVKC